MWHAAMDTVVPKLTNFRTFGLLPNILEHWYTQKRDLTLKQVDPEAVCFCRSETGKAVVDCSSTACPILSYHLSCHKLTAVPNKWLCHLTWVCADCSAGNLNSNAKVKKNNINNANASKTVSSPKNGNLNDYHYKLITSNSYR